MKAKKPIISWFPNEILQNDIDYYTSNKENALEKLGVEPTDTDFQIDEQTLKERIEELIYADEQFILELAWESEMDYLSEYLDKINPDGYWVASIENFGWRSTSGYSYIRTDEGKECSAIQLLRKVLPDTDNHFYVYKHKRGIKINNYHHDSPSGREWYYLIPIKSSTFFNETYHRRSA